MKDRTLGVSSLVIAAAIPMFIVLFGVAGAAGMPSAAQAEPRLAAAFFHDHPLFVAAIFLNSIVMHVAVVVLAIGLYARLVSTGGLWIAVGTALGVAWAVLDIAQSSIAYSATLAAPSADAVTVDAIAKGIQNAAHLGGGIWVLSIAFAGAAVLGRALRGVGFVVGTVFALHTLVVPLVPAWWMLEYIGLPLFFGWTGVALLRGARPPAVVPAMNAQQA